jgi:O-antigen chain-terminating methyltransferase
MSQDASIDDVMRRIHARVEGRNNGMIRPAGATATVAQATPASVPEFERERPADCFDLPVNDLGQLRSEIETALEGTRRVGEINPRNPGLHNALIQFLKKTIRRSLTWYTRPLRYFQGGVIRALQRIEGLLANHERSFQRMSQELDRQTVEITEQQRSRARLVQAMTEEQSRNLASLDGRVSSLLERRISEVSADLKTELARVQSIGDEKLEQVRMSLLKTELARVQSIGDERLEQMRMSLERRVSNIADDVAKLRLMLNETGESVRRWQLQARVRDRDLRRFLHDIRNGVIQIEGRESFGAVPPMFPSGIRRDYEFDYFAFEDLYRGDEGLIRRRQEEYVHYFRGRENVLDVGCGRGEFLQLLRENNIAATGVEHGTDQFLLCKEKGLDVVQQDLFSYLESLPDNSLGGLFSAQVIEHLTASDQLRCITLAYQKTKAGSPVVVETINAQCVWAVMRNFFLDPTHVRPVHPETLKFAMESANFRDVTLVFSSPVSERRVPPLELEGEARNLQEFNRQLQNLNDLLYGNQDYAAVGWH